MQQSFDEGENFNPTLPMLEICVEYKNDEETFNFYIKQISNCPLTPSFSSLRAKVNVYISKGMSRTTWMGWQKSISWQEMRSHNMEKFSTLSVLRSATTVCNEFFTCPVPQLQLHFTAMRVVLCDVNKDDEEDLGELHFSISFLSTAERIVVTNLRTTNLLISNKDEFYIRAVLITEKDEYEAHKTEPQICSKLIV
ncbi:hypothetical protein WR25_11143 [Diploscapter pachys]|uniref:Uncharacterized protein n=1 Tax=Diploscapter pachys TaxID=2018661 RepID=A0A2A2JJD9_9BILA|nr:hypothetical protein WR25_11143 [Diploscapter pachys]